VWISKDSGAPFVDTNFASLGSVTLGAILSRNGKVVGSDRHQVLPSRKVMGAVQQIGLTKAQLH
jgi:hypothetical protein